jgi:hypothetical protein
VTFFTAACWPIKRTYRRWNDDDDDDDDDNDDDDDDNDGDKTAFAKIKYCIDGGRGETRREA